jgi:oxygen-independent coproporphyrinogen-3 oxidase
LKGAVHPQGEEVDAQMYAYVIDALNNAGYEQYEVSNFAKPSRRCKHNLVYWHGEEYVSVGPSAHGFIANTRYWNLRSLTAWTQAVEEGRLPYANTETLSAEELLNELAFLTLRADGLPLQRFTDEFGIDLRVALQPDLGYWIEEGMMRDDGSHLRLTSIGYAVCDEITIKVMSHLTDKIEKHQAI